MARDTARESVHVFVLTSDSPSYPARHHGRTALHSSCPAQTYPARIASDDAAVDVASFSAEASFSAASGVR